MTDYSYRWAVPDDLAYLTNSWLKSYSHSRAAQECIKVYRYEADQYINKLVRSENIRNRICCLSDEHASIMGWATYRLQPKPVIYYTYVRKEIRRRGIAKKLLEEIISEPDISFTHKPVPNYDDRGNIISGVTLPNSWIYNPYLNFYT